MSIVHPGVCATYSIRFMYLGNMQRVTQPESCWGWGQVHKAPHRNGRVHEGQTKKHVQCETKGKKNLKPT